MARKIIERSGINDMDDTFFSEIRVYSFGVFTKDWNNHKNSIDAKVEFSEYGMEDLKDNVDTLAFADVLFDNINGDCYGENITIADKTINCAYDDSYFARYSGQRGVWLRLTGRLYSTKQLQAW